MSKIRGELLDQMTKDYKPLYRFLKDADYLEPVKAKGTFLVPKNWCYQGEGEVGHFTDSERIFCFNQLGYIMLAEAFERGDVPHAPKIMLKDFYLLQKSSSLIVGSTNIAYKKQLISTEPFQGLLELKDCFLKKNGQLIFFDITYNFGENHATGEMRSAIVLSDLEKIINEKSDKT